MRIDWYVWSDECNLGRLERIRGAKSELQLKSFTIVEGFFGSLNVDYPSDWFNVRLDTRPLTVARINLVSFVLTGSYRWRFGYCWSQLWLQVANPFGWRWALFGVSSTLRVMVSLWDYSHTQGRRRIVKMSYLHGHSECERGNDTRLTRKYFLSQVVTVK